MYSQFIELRSKEIVSPAKLGTVLPYKLGQPG